MDQPIHAAIIAVDGGGTHCRVACRDGGVLRAVETGPANVSTDFDGAVRAVTDGLRRLADAAGQAPGALFQAPAFVGLAGMTGAEMAARLARALPLTNARIADDRPAAVRGALGGRDGVLAHCGTGSFFAARNGGAIRLAGGWGPVLGDEASAQWIGRMALRIALDHADGLCAASPMAALLLARHGGAAGVVALAGEAGPSALGAIAPLVTAHAAEGDALAGRVMRAGAAEIARTLTALGWRPGVAICLTGGAGPHFAAYLPPEMQSCRIAARGTPLDGALSLAGDLARELADERR